MTVQVRTKYGMRLNRLLNKNLSYDTFRSEICHMYHFDGDFAFISKTMETNLVMALWNRKEYVKAFYVLAMIDYISWKHDVPLFDGFSQIRMCRLEKTLYPTEVVMLDKIEHSHKHRDLALETCRQDKCGVFFYRHNIIERSIEDVI